VLDLCTLRESWFECHKRWYPADIVTFSRSGDFRR
jgi:hypothetical protein